MVDITHTPASKPHRASGCIPHLEGLEREGVQGYKWKGGRKAGTIHHPSSYSGIEILSSHYPTPLQNHLVHWYTSHPKGILLKVARVDGVGSLRWEEGNFYTPSQDGPL